MSKHVDKQWLLLLTYCYTTLEIIIYLLLKSCLNDRSFKVKLETTLSSSQLISAGVPQGSDIAPFLCTLFTADIPTSDTTLTYADDTAVLSSTHDLHEANFQLQNHLNNLIHWFKSWTTKVNDSKSAHVTFALHPEVCRPLLKFNNVIKPQTSEVKYLDPSV